MSKQRLFLLSALMIATVVTVPAWASGGMRDQRTCNTQCRESYVTCKRSETTETVMQGPSCSEMKDMCLSRCANIAEYLDCKDSGRENCKQNFQDNVKDYRPYLDNR